MTEYIYHIAREKEWLAALELGEYMTASLETEGFIHCSTRRQVANTANRYFSGEKDLILLEIDPNSVVCEIRFDPFGEELFPHIYGPINLDAVVDVIRYEPDAAGTFGFPAGESKE